MTIHVEAIRRLRAIETSAAANFTVDLSTATASFVDIAAIEGSISMTLDQPTIDPGTIRQNIFDHNKEILGVKRATLTFEQNLGPQDTMAATNVAATITPAGFLLDLTMGNYRTGTGDTATNSTDKDTCHATSGRFPAGSALGWVNSNSKLELREVEDESSGTITLKLDTSATIATNDILYACTSYYLDDPTSTNQTAVQFIVESLDTEDNWVLLGGQISSPMGITFTNGEIPKLSWTFEFPDWLNGDDAALTPAALSDASYSNLNEIVIVDSTFRCGTIGTSAITGTEYDISEFTLEPAWKFHMVPTPGGANNVHQWIAMPDHPVVTGTFTLPYEAQTFRDHKASRTNMYIMFQIGSTVAGGAMLISLPTIQITDVQRVDVDGVQSETVSFVARIDEDRGSATSDLSKSPIRIHIF
jgi:hypothetical protein